ASCAEPWNESRPGCPHRSHWSSCPAPANSWPGRRSGCRPRCRCERTRWPSGWGHRSRRPPAPTRSRFWQRRMAMAVEHSAGPVVVKVGGSLYDWPDLAGRLQDWLGQPSERRVLLVPGGGVTADVVRDLDQRHALGEERAHWLALHALALNAHFLAAL